MLELYIKEQDGNIEISLKDDCDGFDMETVNRGNGLDNMQQRARKMQANCRVVSERDQGTWVTIAVRITS